MLKTVSGYKVQLGNKRFGRKFMSQDQANHQINPNLFSKVITSDGHY